jgi:hypothetical protein
MFDTALREAPLVVAADDADWFDPDWCEQVPEPVDIGQVPAAQSAASGWLALELDQVTADPARLSDADLIDTIVGFDRVTSWAAARQAALLAEFARRRPVDEAEPMRGETPSRYSGYAADEIGLALRLSRTAASTRLTMAEVLAADLPATHAAWESGTIDTLKARAIVEASYVLPREQRGALEARVLAKAGEQPVARLRAALRRAVLALDPGGAEDRFEQRRAQRRVVISPDQDEGMATLWALLSAHDATAAYQHLCGLARGLGAEDPRGMDARRADLLIDLLTGRDLPIPTPAITDPAITDPAITDPATTDPATTDPAPARNQVRAGRPSVSVIVPLTMLMGLDEEPGELVGYGPIPAALAREIAAEGTWRRLLTDPVSGALLDYGRTTYTPPAGLADFVRARDVHCRRPGCGQRAATADLDHAVPWPDGPTSESNLHSYCRHDHLVKTFAPGWKVLPNPDGTVTWTTPTGHTYTSQPYDYRPNPGPDPPGTPGLRNSGPATPPPHVEVDPPPF